MGARRGPKRRKGDATAVTAAAEAKSANHTDESASKQLRQRKQQHQEQDHEDQLYESDDMGEGTDNAGDSDVVADPGTREDSDLEHNLDEDGTGKAVSAGAEGSRKRARDSQFALPTASEQDHLRQARSLFASNLLKLEIDELLDQVRVIPSPTQGESLRAALFKIKECLENAKPVTEVTAAKARVSLVDWAQDKPVTLDFAPPTAIDVVGSFLLQTLARPSRTIDLAVTMPASCFAAKDYLNYRYADKRTLYLGMLAKALAKSRELVAEVTFAPFASDISKPTLLVKLADKALAKFAIRILPVVTEEAFSPARFRPGQSNVRASGRFQSTQGAPLTPTPHYNMSVLEDIDSSSYRAHLRLLHVVQAECQSFAQTCVLLKVWARVNGFSKDAHPDAFHEGLLVFLLAHLLLDRHLNATMSVQQMFRSLMAYISTTDLATGKVLRMRPAFQTAPEIHEGFDDNAIRGAFAINLIGPCGRLNFSWRVSRTAWAALRAQAISATQILERSSRDGGKDTFSALFTTKVNMWQQFDKYIAIQVPPLKLARDAELSPEMYAEMCDLPWDAFLRRRAEAIFHRAFIESGRATDMRIIANTDQARSWHPSKAPELGNILVCLRLDLTQAFRQLDKGPGADMPKAAAAFRAFWGDRAELRRFRDGSILETLDWSEDARKGDLPGAISAHLMAIHWPFSLTETKAGRTALVGAELDSALAKLDEQQSRRTHSQVPEDAFKVVKQAFERLVKRLRALNLPLSVTGVAPADPALRYAAAIQPSPHPMAFGSNDNAQAALITAAQRGAAMAKGKTSCAAASVSSLVNAIDAVLELESSGQWPDDVEAIERMKTAFYVQIAEQLNKSSRGMQRAIAARNCLEVLSEGYAFRFTVRVDRQVELLRNPRTSFVGSVSRAAARAMHGNTMANESPAAIAERLATARKLEQATIRRPLLHLHLHALHTRTDRMGGAFVMGPVVRLAKLWVSGHGLWSHLSEEAVELLVACVFLHPQPYQAPRSAACGFMRFLRLVAQWDWENEPLLVNLNDGFAPDAGSEVLKSFMESRDRGTSAHMFIVTPDDRDRAGAWVPFWTDRSHPTEFALKRLVQLASDSLSLLERLFGLQAAGEYSVKQMAPLWTALFQTSPTEAGLDVILRLKPDPAIFGAGTGSRGSAKIYKNLVQTERLIVGMNPIAAFAGDVQNLVGHLFQVFYDPFRGDWLGLKWVPSALDPVPIRIAVAGFAMPLQDQDADQATASKKARTTKDAKRGFLVVPNLAEICTEIEHIGAGLVDTIQLV